MNLENRVETLEHELKILKSEIEGTLLEIQNQVLIHYYPELRAQDSATAQEMSMALPIRTKPSKTAPSEATPPQPPAPPTAGATMQMREVTLREVEDDHGLTATSSLAAVDKLLGPVALAHLAKWANSAVAQVGKAQTTAVVEAYTDADACTDEVKAALMQLILLCQEEAAPSPVDTNALMQISFKLNQLFGQVAALTAATEQPLRT